MFFFKSYRIFILLFISFFLGCPNSSMKDLVEDKVSPPVAEDFYVNDGATITNNPEVQIVASVEDGYEMRFSNDKETWSGWIKYQDVYEWTMTDTAIDGIKTVYAQYRDEGHHVIEKTYDIELDTEAPNTAIIRGNSITNVSLVSWTWSPSTYGMKAFRYVLENAEDKSIVDSKTVSADVRTYSRSLNDGNYNFYVDQQESSGSWSVTNKDDYFNTIVDTVAPNIPSVKCSESSPTNNPRPTWSWEAIKDSTKYRYRINESAWTTITSNSFIPSSDLENGTYKIEVQAGDDAGNWSGTGSNTIVIDIYSVNAPKVTSELASTNNPRPKWTWSAVSGANNYRYSYNNKTWIGTTTGTSYTPSVDLSEGAHTLYVQAQNTVSEDWSDSGSFTVTINLSAPALTDIVIANSSDAPIIAVIGDTISVTFTASDENGISDSSYVSIAGNNIALPDVSGNEYSVSYTMDSDDAEGEIIIGIYIYDNLGNLTSTVENTGIIFDSTNPVLTDILISSSNANGSYAKVGDTISVTFTASDANGIDGSSYVLIAGNDVSLTNVSGDEYSASYTMTSGDTEGEVNCEIFIFDTVGNTVSEEINPGITFDTTNPVLNIDYISSSNANSSYAKVGDQISLHFQVTDTGSGISTENSYVSVAGNIISIPNPEDEGWCEVIYTMTAGDTEGNINAGIYIYDNAGNLTSGDENTIVFDRTPPLITNFKINNGNQYTCSSYVVVDYSVSDNITATGDLNIEFSSNAGGTSLDPGLNSVYAPICPTGTAFNTNCMGNLIVTDRAGNVGFFPNNIYAMLNNAEAIRYESSTAPSYIYESAKDLGDCADWDDNSDWDELHLQGDSYGLEGLATLYDEDWYTFYLSQGEAPQITITLDEGNVADVQIVAYSDNGGELTAMTVSNDELLSTSSRRLTFSWEVSVVADAPTDVVVRIYLDGVAYTGVLYNLDFFVQVY